MGYPVALPDPITPATRGLLGLAGLATTGISGDLTLTKTGTTARTVTFPDAAIEVQAASEARGSGNFTARLGGVYAITATATVTDPTPAEGRGFEVFVRNGTATIGGTAYATAGTYVHRLYHSGAWSNYVYPHIDAAWTWTQAQTIDRGTGALPSIVGGSGTLVVAHADGTPPRMEAFGFNTTAIQWRGRMSGGTRAALSASPDGVAFFNLQCNGYDGTAWADSGAYRMVADGSWSGSNRGAYHLWQGVSNGSVSAAAEWMRLQNGVLSLSVNTPSTSTTTGSILSPGGLGVVGQTTTSQIATTVTTDSSTGTINALANPTGFIRLTGATPDVRGIANPGTVARRVILYCVNATTLTHEGGTASAADRITSDTGANIAVAAGKTVELIYDPTSTRWRPVRF